MEGMMAGAMVGMGGAAISGISAAGAGGAGLRGIGQAGLQLIKSAPQNIMTNFGQGLFSDVSFKVLDGVTYTLDTYGQTGQASVTDLFTGIKESSFGDINAVKSIVTTGGSAQDWLAAGMLLMPSGKKGGKSKKLGIVDDTTPNNKPNGDAPNQKKKNSDDADTTKPKHTEVESKPKKQGEGEAYELAKPRKEKINDRLKKHAKDAKQEAKLSIKQKASIQRSKDRAINAKTDKDRAYHEMMAKKKERMYMGTQIDTIFKKNVDSDKFLQSEGLRTTPRGKKGPDVYDKSNKEYWDLTTEKDWNKGTHQVKYDRDFGDGTGIFW